MQVGGTQIGVLCMATDRRGWCSRPSEDQQPRSHPGSGLLPACEQTPRAADTVAVKPHVTETRWAGRGAGSAWGARGLHEPDRGPAIGSSFLADDLEAEGLIERDVARVAGFEEGGAPARPGPLEAVPDQCPAKSLPLRGRGDGDHVE